ncbi:uncharacterized protein [Notamacropus eugenii]|uniref:uncharacterized protein n=1 Tax=Notamacropus eugenii TaxID=9315 RepID=UPI003B679614
MPQWVLQILISRSSVCLENYPGGRFYGEDAASLRDGAVACPLLVPLLRSFTQMLKGAQGHCPVFGDRRQEKDLRSVFQRHPCPQASQQSELVPIQPSDLSAREFVIYQHGLSMLQFLIPHIKNDQNKLFILRECLASVGNFSLLLIHCLAHITAADLYWDSNPVFLKLFYEGLEACLSDAFSVKLQMSAVFHNKKSDQGITDVLLKGEPTSEERDLLSNLIDTKVKFYRDPESPEEIIKKNKRHLLFTNFEHFLKNKLSLEQQILTENTTLRVNKSSETKSLPHFNKEEKKELDSLMQQLTKLLEKGDDF